MLEERAVVFHYAGSKLGGTSEHAVVRDSVPQHPGYIRRYFPIQVLLVRTDKVEHRVRV